VREVLVPGEAPPSNPSLPIRPTSRPSASRQRELEILTLIARDFANREIATQLFVSENTVKTHCIRAFDKLGAARRTHAVQRGKELALVP
jgi:ATP/maltotriose-dependent transcriptional regulator MalT